MAKEKLEDLCNGVLRKRKKFVFFIMGVCFGMSFFIFCLMIFIGKPESTIILVFGLLLLICALIMFMTGKKIDTELARRKDT